MNYSGQRTDILHLKIYAFQNIFFLKHIQNNNILTSVQFITAVRQTEKEKFNHDKIRVAPSCGDAAVRISPCRGAQRIFRFKDLQFSAYRWNTSRSLLGNGAPRQRLQDAFAER